jgi:hypothetical protein
MAKKPQPTSQPDPICIICLKPKYAHPTPANQLPSGAFIYGIKRPWCTGCYYDDPPKA